MLQRASMSLKNSESAEVAANRAHVATLLLDVVSDVLREVRKDLRSSPTSQNSCLTVAQFRILATLWIEPLNNKSLAEAVGLSIPAVSRMVKLLEAKGLIERMPGLKDKREVRIRLTMLGTQLYRNATGKLSHRLDERMKFISASKLRKAQAGLLALKEIFVELQFQSSSAEGISQ